MLSIARTKLRTVQSAWLNAPVLHYAGADDLTQMARTAVCNHSIRPTTLPLVAAAHRSTATHITRAAGTRSRQQGRRHHRSSRRSSETRRSPLPAEGHHRFSTFTRLSALLGRGGQARTDRHSPSYDESFVARQQDGAPAAAHLFNLRITTLEHRRRYLHCPAAREGHPKGLDLRIHFIASHTGGNPEFRFLRRVEEHEEVFSGTTVLHSGRAR